MDRCYFCPLCSGWLNPYRYHGRPDIAWRCTICFDALRSDQVSNHFKTHHFGSTSSVNTCYIKRESDFRHHMEKIRPDKKATTAHHKLAADLDRALYTELTIQDTNMQAVRCCDHCGSAFSGMATFLDHAKDIVNHVHSNQGFETQLLGHLRLPELSQAWQNRLASRGLRESYLCWNPVGAAPSDLLRRLESVWCYGGPTQAEAEELAATAMALASMRL